MFTGSRNQRVEPMSRIRQRIAERLKGSQNNYATLTTFNECDMSQAMKLRSDYNEAFNKKYGTKIGFMSIFLKAATTALMEMPSVNSVIEGDNIIYRDFIDISVAVSTPTGLMVPVIRNCESKSFSDFELILKDLSVMARENKIKVEDMQGGTFTITNGGVFGSMMGTPIINPPQSAILGMHNIVNRPVCVGDEIVARPIM
jgi:2-oxoglutarate dehydrogenase E2 component (dihydrolipoamide succinyltransferase)